MKKPTLTEEESISVKNSLKNIYTLFLNKESIKPQYLSCVVKWGLQLDLTKDEIQSFYENEGAHIFNAPKNRVDAIQGLFDLIHLIYLDDMVEDDELEVATIYAEAMGFAPHVVGDILKTIITAPADGIRDESLREEIKNLAREHFIG